MSARYLLDTNMVSDLIRNPGGRVAARIGRLGETQVCINLIVAGEIRFGVAKRNSPRLTVQAEKILSVLPMAPFESPLDCHYADIRNALETAGTPIGPNGLWIAAHARALRAILVTDTAGEFARVPALRVENWLE